MRDGTVGATSLRSPHLVPTKAAERDTPFAVRVFDVCILLSVPRGQARNTGAGPGRRLIAKVFFCWETELIVCRQPAATCMWPWKGLLQNYEGLENWLACLGRRSIEKAVVQVVDWAQ